MKSLLLLPILILPLFLKAQNVSDVITEEETSRIVHVLASDSLKGRGNGQIGALMAANFIAEEFSKIGLSTFNDYPGYYFPFYPEKKRRKDTASEPPVSVKAHLEWASLKLLYNIVGILPGKSKSKEIIVFSAHYDHLGIRSGKKGDNIWNGANDNASGTTALLMLAKYFAARNDNERTLMFCAFSGEELGLKGSAHFMRYIDTANTIVNINIEMIGVKTSREKTVFITGAKASTFADIFEKNVASEELRIKDDPDPDKEYYLRSDNYSFVQAKVIGHSIMASSDKDKCYHSFCDEVDRLDIPNMTAIIRAIAKGARTLVNGEDTPKKAKRNN